MQARPAFVGFFCACGQTDASCGGTIALALLVPTGVAATITGGIGWGVTHRRLRRHLGARPRRYSLLPGALAPAPGHRQPVPGVTLSVRS